MVFARGSAFLALLIGISACGSATALGSDADPHADGSVEGGGATDVGNDRSSSCAEQVHAASELVSLAARAAEQDSLACQTDDDCLSVSLVTNCSDQCTALVGRDGADRIRAAIDRANETSCRGFADAGCLRIAPPCNPGPPWKCVGATCARVPR